MKNYYWVAPTNIICMPNVSVAQPLPKNTKLFRTESARETCIKYIKINEYYPSQGHYKCHVQLPKLNIDMHSF